MYQVLILLSTAILTLGVESLISSQTSRLTPNAEDDGLVVENMPPARRHTAQHSLTYSSRHQPPSMPYLAYRLMITVPSDDDDELDNEHSRHVQIYMPYGFVKQGQGNNKGLLNNDIPLKSAMGYFSDYDSNMDENTGYVAGFDEKRIPSTKRGLSILSRWGELNKLGRDRTPIRSAERPTDDYVSAETRARPVSQPLRWG